MTGMVEFCYSVDFDGLIRHEKRKVHAKKAVEWKETGDPKLAKHSFILTAIRYFDKLRADDRYWR